MTDTTTPVQGARRSGGVVIANMEPEFGALIRDIFRLMRRNFELRAQEAKLPLTRLQASALLRIARRQGISQAKLANALDVQPIMVVEILDKLQAMELIERRKAAGDRRVHELWLKPAATPMLEQILVIIRSVRKVAFASFSSEQRDALFAGLARVRENLSCPPEFAEEAEKALAERKAGLRGNGKQMVSKRR
jgi:MarR family transcriptional regulator, transcriptional regulator for hemolysin